MTYRENVYGTGSGLSCIDFASLLTRNRNGELGLAISSVRNLDGSTGVIISEILDERTSNNQLNVGDQIISVNGIPLRNKPYRFCVQVLRESGNLIHLIIHRCNVAASYNTKPQVHTGGRFGEPQRLQKQQSSVELYRTEFEPRQLPVAHSQSCSNLQPPENRKPANLTTVHLDKRENDESLGVELVSRIFVNSVDEGGLGDKCGLRNGDRLISLNGVNTAHLSLVDTAKILRRQETLLEVARGRQAERLSRSGLADSNISMTAYSKHQPGVVTNRKYIGNPRKKQQFSEHRNLEDSPKEDIRFSSLHDLQPRNKPVCQKCSETRSLQGVSQPHSLSHSDSECQLMYRRGSRKHQDAYHKHKHKYCKDPCRPYTKDRSWTASPGTVGESDDGLASSETVTADEQRPAVHKFQEEATKLKSQSDVRQVLFHMDPRTGTGLALVGGNRTGVFVATVQPDSAADQSGIGEGDQIRAINELELDGWTKEEVALALIADDAPIVLSLKHDPAAYSEVQQSNQSTDFFSVRAYFNLKPDGYTQKNSEGLTELAITEGDIFQVLDTFPGGVFGNWQAYKIYPSVSVTGIIPNMQRAKGLLEVQTATSSVRAPTPYEKVILIDSYPLPRPVVIYGPLSFLARQRLQGLTDSMEPEEKETSTRFEVPPVNAHIGQTGPEGYPTGLIRLSAVKMIMENGAHCLLDINMSAIKRLTFLGIPPIVILICPSSKKQLTMVLQHYWEIDKYSAALQYPDLLVKKRSDVLLLSERLWAEVLALKQYRAHLISDSVPVNTENVRGLYFSEVDWIRNLVSVVQHQQNGPVWIGEDAQLTGEILQLCANVFSDDAEVVQAEEVKSFKITRQNGTNVDRQVSARALKEEFRSPLKRRTSINRLQDKRTASYKATAKATPTGKCSNHKNSHSSVYKEFLPVEVLSVHGSNSPRTTTPSDVENYNGVVEQISTETHRWLDSFNSDSFDSDLTTEWAASQSRLAESIRTSVPFLVPTLMGRLYPSVGTSNKEFERLNIVTNSPTPHVNREDLRFRPKLLLDATSQNEDFASVQPRGKTDPSKAGIDDISLTSQVLEDTQASPGGASNRSIISSLPLNTTENILAECAGEFGYKGGALELPEYQVRLHIPKGALPVQCERQRIFLRIYNSHPDCTLGSARATEESSPRLISPVVMCGPHGLHFRTPVELTVPRYHFDDDNNEESNENWKITLLHTSAHSTSADEESVRQEVKLRQNSTNWHEIPVIGDLKTSGVRPTEKINGNSDVLGITSLVQDSKIAILIDHF
ncbi:Tight junction protein ZO-1 [Clonorchis sinensis]|uniref:Tight junction protein ZO-1 n=1 Tax=Clonorchis sinensis TaxID=79923 RepID=A0A8T1M6F8_CLOSI|nr:Tight junction protein ZO-1 [Clonorchis sinensis]